MGAIPITSTKRCIMYHKQKLYHKQRLYYKLEPFISLYDVEEDYFRMFYKQCTDEILGTATVYERSKVDDDFYEENGIPKDISDLRYFIVLDTGTWVGTDEFLECVSLRDVFEEWDSNEFNVYVTFSEKEFD